MPIAKQAEILARYESIITKMRQLLRNPSMPFIELVVRKGSMVQIRKGGHTWEPKPNFFGSGPSWEQKKWTVHVMHDVSDLVRKAIGYVSYLRTRQQSHNLLRKCCDVAAECGVGGGRVAGGGGSSSGGDGGVCCGAGDGVRVVEC